MILKVLYSTNKSAYLKKYFQNKLSLSFFLEKKREMIFLQDCN